MVWAKLDDAILDNPKIARAGVLGFALHVAAITWCCRNLTDGFIPSMRVTCLLDLSKYGMSIHDKEEDPQLPGVDPHDVADWLVECDLWREVPGGYELHDFLVYNPPKQKVVADRERGAARAEAARAKKHGRRNAVRSREVTADVQSESVPASHGPVPDPQEISVSGSLSSDLFRPDPDPPGKLDPPAWFAAAASTAAMSAGEITDLPGRWLEYVAARSRKGWPMNQQDAAGWLSNVARSERARGPSSGPRLVRGSLLQPLDGLELPVGLR